MFHFSGIESWVDGGTQSVLKTHRPYFLRAQARLRLVTSLTDYEEILKLRHESYLDAEKIEPGTDVTEMRSAWDAESKIYGIYLNEFLVGTVRVFVPSDEIQTMENIDHALGYYPADFPKKSEVIEMSHLCIRRGYRRSDLTKFVFALGLETLATTGRTTILISADARLKPKYSFMGFKATRHRYRKPKSLFPDLTIMQTNLKRFGFYGLHVDPIRWNIFLRDMTDSLIDRGILRPDPLIQPVLKFYRSFAPFAEGLERTLAEVV